MDAKDKTDAYHRHLDECLQCREHPFNQCPVGHVLLVAAGSAAADRMAGGVTLSDAKPGKDREAPCRHQS